ncbi:Transcriptional regulator [Hoeflea phototrophica DFL-43]|uniref:Transcriptional regulator n=1 Tax=Hoeflea phototrophica (strain DSM 17068 / NCIMB 14078 / DFL-43) TaxID=411684 RepID=A9D712_HOEPD|nr:LacI family DNA-binding transcriptional regulator [Hoeflea phototrophica]EDQ33635.1 Transcriptional regulator [Hoeflea phototrophica DFL-43]
MTLQRRPTIIDVARQAGVSKSTVSLVLQNSSSVKEETRKAVREAMAEIGYVYNRAAANMRMSNAGLIGLVINDLRNPFFTEFATSLQMALAGHGYSTVVANTDESPELQDQVVGSMIEHGVSAFIICPAYGEDSSTFDMIAKAGIPAMQMLRRVDDRLKLFPFTAPDYRAGSEVATRHLISAGAKRIAFIGGLEGRRVTEERKAGYLDVLHEIDMDPVILTGKASRKFGKESAGRLMSEHPDVNAVICFNDLVALGMLSGCHELGVSVGTDLLIVGFDDIEEIAHAYPSLSSVHCDIAGIGSQAAANVVGWLEKGQVPAPETRTPISLCIRQSTGGTRKAGS